MKYCFRYDCFANCEGRCTALERVMDDCTFYKPNTEMVKERNACTNKLLRKGRIDLINYYSEANKQLFRKV